MLMYDFHPYAPIDVNIHRDEVQSTQLSKGYARHVVYPLEQSSGYARHVDRSRDNIKTA